MTQSGHSEVYGNGSKSGCTVGKRYRNGGSLADLALDAQRAVMEVDSQGG